MSERPKAFSSFVLFTVGAAIGTILMYIADPISGRRRRAYWHDKRLHMQKSSMWQTRKQVRNFGNHLQGALSTFFTLFSKEDPPSDAKLESRVRSLLGRVGTHPSTLEVTARAGVVTLHGKVPSIDIAHYYSRARAVRGVKRVINQMEALAACKTTEETAARNQSKSSECAPKATTVSATDSSSQPGIH
jgi:hypothetical protein